MVGYHKTIAVVAELADALVLGTSGATHPSSTLGDRTTFKTEHLAAGFSISHHPPYAVHCASMVRVLHRPLFKGLGKPAQPIRRQP